MITSKQLLGLGFVKKTVMKQTYYYFNNPVNFQMKGFFKNGKFIEDPSENKTYLTTHDSISSIVRRLCQINQNIGREATKMAIKEFLNDI